MCINIADKFGFHNNLPKDLAEEEETESNYSNFTEKPLSGTSVGLQLNVVRENDQMISFNTVVMYSIVSISFLMIWLFYSSSTAGFIYYNLSIGFFLAFTITPPLYFFNNLSSFKIGVSLVGEMFN